MQRTALFLAAVIASSGCMAAESTAPPLACVVQDSCGCSILVDGGSCPDGGVHFFHELADGAPLQFSAGQGPVTAVAVRPGSGTFSPGPGESWTETYRHDGGDVQIHYSPGASTCPKLPQGEQCEYFDVRARVLISGPRGTQSYSGVGTCGC